MLGRLYERENCSAARALELIGERWSLLIIRLAAFAGTTRFSEFQSGLGIATNVLSDRLEGFVAADLMRRQQIADGTGQEYVLTPRGHELAVVVVALTEWGDRWAAPKGPPIVFEHAGCGGSLHLIVDCAGCGHSVPPEEISAMPGPGATAQQRRRRAR